MLRRLAVIVLSLAAITVATTDASADKKTRRRSAPAFSGHNAAKSTLRKEALPRPSGEVWLKAENLNEEFKGNIYKADGSFDDAALAKMDEMFRCIYTGEVRAVRAELYEQMSRIYDHFGKQIQLVSGFRYGNGERDSSRHWHAAAMDIRVVGVSVNEAYAYAQTLDMGGEHAMGIGIYPTSQFIHVDYRSPGEPSFRWVDNSGPLACAYQAFDRPHVAGSQADVVNGSTIPARTPANGYCSDMLHDPGDTLVLPSCACTHVRSSSRSCCRASPRSSSPPVARPFLGRPPRRADLHRIHRLRATRPVHGTRSPTSRTTR